MSKLLGATSVLVLAALGVAIASLVFNILIYNNQVSTSVVPDPSTIPIACPTLNPSTQPTTPKSYVDDDNGISTTSYPDPSTTSEFPEPSTNSANSDPSVNPVVPPAPSAPYNGPVSDDPYWKEAVNRILATANLSADPCHDFYQFTCGNYVENTDLEGQSRKGTSDEAQYTINLGLADYFDSQKLRDLNSNTEKYQKIFLDLCVTDGKRDPAEPSVRKAMWADLSKDLDANLGFPLFGVKKYNNDVWTAMGRMERQFTGGPLVTAVVTSDFKDSTKNALYINQPALRFDRDIYVNPQFTDKLQAYADDIRDLLLAYGFNTGRRFNHDFCQPTDTMGRTLTERACAQQIAEWAVDFERNLAMASWPDNELRNYQQKYTKVYWNLVLFFYDFQSLHLDSYVKALLNVDDDELKGFKVVLTNPTYIAALDGMFGVNTIKTDEFTNYLALHFLIENAAEYGIDIPSTDESVERDRKETDTESKLHRYTTRRGHGARRISRRPVNSKGLAVNEIDAIRASCVDTLIDYMPFGPGFTYVKNREDRDAVLKDVKAQTDNIVTQIGRWKMMNLLDWMDEATLNRAIDKNRYLVQNYLWPKFFGDYYNFESIDNYNHRYAVPESLEGETYWDALKQLKAGFQATEQFDIVDQPGDRSNFLLSPATVGVWYQPERNSLTIPFGVLNPPYYSPNYPEQYNYAGAGAVIGQESWRAYDDEGAQFGREGMLADCTFSHCSILDTQSQRGFDDMADCVVHQYNSQCCPLGRRCANGEATKRANLADIGGLQAAYYAYSGYASSDKHTLPGLEQFTNLQIFWMSHGVSMCSKLTDEQLKTQLTTGTQAPSSCRVNQAIQDIPQFGKDFLCKYRRGVFPMYPDEEDRCAVWVGVESESKN